MCVSNDISQWSPKLNIQAVKDASPWMALIMIEWTSSVNLTVILISCLFWCCILFSAFTSHEEWLLTSWCLSVCPSVHMEQLGSHWTDFPEIWYLSIFWNTVEKIQVSLKSDKHNWYFTWRSLDIFDHILPSSSENEKCFKQKLLKKTKQNFCSVTFFFTPPNRAVYVIMWKNVAEWDRSQTTILCMCIACRILRPTNTHTQAM
jgi:hypothetical protein